LCWGSISVIGVARPGSSDLKQRENKRFFVVESSEDVSEASSTLIRQRLKENKPIDDLTCKKVVEYIQTTNLLQ
jgi:nicotinic acid mononucleotide adenylyltransferase